jgi:hypothetical protein
MCPSVSEGGLGHKYVYQIYSERRRRRVVNFIIIIF